MRGPDPVANPGEQRKATHRTTAGRAGSPPWIQHVAGLHFLVEGKLEPFYNVKLDEWERCDCAAFCWTGQDCKHVREVLERIARIRTRTA